MKQSGLPLETIRSDRYYGPKVCILPCVEARRRPSYADTKFALLTQWRVDFSPSTGEEGEVWQLVRFNSLGEAIWRRIDFTNSGPGISQLTSDDDSQIEPDGIGNINLVTGIRDNCTKPIQSYSNGLNTLSVDLQVSTSLEHSPDTMLDAGVCSFHSKHFNVNENGYVKLAGGKGPSIQSVLVESHTHPGCKTVLPDSDGQIKIDGEATYPQNKPIAIHSYEENSYTIEVQVAKELDFSPYTFSNAGICSFDEMHFDVSSHGHVRLTNDGLSVNKIEVDKYQGISKYPVRPNENGKVKFNASVVSNHSVPIEIVSRIPSDITVETQVACAIEDGQYSNTGLASFNNSQFNVTNQGFVSLNLPVSGSHGQTFNLAFSLDTTYLTFHDISGMPLTSTNPGYVILSSNKEKGQLVIHKITENLCMKLSLLMGQTFGTTQNVAWNEELPLYMGFTVDENDQNLAPVISRVPNSNSIGSFRATKDEEDVWTILPFEDDGIGKWNENKKFKFPVGQNGADKKSYFILNGSTYVPEFEECTFEYRINKSGMVDYKIKINRCNSDGEGDVPAMLAIPFKTDISMGGYHNEKSVFYDSENDRLDLNCQISDFKIDLSSRLTLRGCGFIDG